MLSCPQYCILCMTRMQVRKSHICQGFTDVYSEQLVHKTLKDSLIAYSTWTLTGHKKPFCLNGEHTMNTLLGHAVYNWESTGGSCFLQTRSIYRYKLWEAFKTLFQQNGKEQKGSSKKKVLKSWLGIGYIKTLHNRSHLEYRCHQIMNVLYCSSLGFPLYQPTATAALLVYVSAVS